MNDFLECIGIAIIILVLFFGFRGCISDKPFVGEHGLIVDTYKSCNQEAR